MRGAGRDWRRFGNEKGVREIKALNQLNDYGRPVYE